MDAIISNSASQPPEDAPATQGENTTVILRSFDNGESHSIVGNMLIGRESDCGICLLHGKISRYHAKVLIENGVIYVEDLQSSNGTFVNGQRVRSATAIDIGDEVQFGDQRYRLTTVANTVISEATILAEPSLVVASSVFSDNDTPTKPNLDEPIVVPQDAAQKSQQPAVEDDDRTRFMSPDLVKNAAQRSSSVNVGKGPRLVVNTAPIRGQVFALSEQQSATIGRDANNDIVLPDASVSREHATISKDDEGYLIQTQNPANGLLVNGFSVQQWRLREGDNIQLGRMGLTFKTDQGPLPSQRSSLDDIDLIKYSLIGLFLVAGVILAIVPWLV